MIKADKADPYTTFAEGMGEGALDLGRFGAEALTAAAYLTPQNWNPSKTLEFLKKQVDPLVELARSPGEAALFAPQVLNPFFALFTSLGLVGRAAGRRDWFEMGRNTVHALAAAIALRGMLRIGSKRGGAEMTPEPAKKTTAAPTPTEASPKPKIASRNDRPALDSSRARHDRGPAGRIREDPKDAAFPAFAERGVFMRTEGVTYAVRAGPAGSWADHLFASFTEAKAYARKLADTGEAAIRESSALPRVWPDGGEGNPVDAIRVFEVPPGTPYIQGVVGPQMEGGTVSRAPRRYIGGGPQVVIPRGVRLGTAISEFQVKGSEHSVKPRKY